MSFVYEIYDNASNNGFINFSEDIPEYITANLRHPLRPYQKEAIGRYLYYKNDEKHRTNPEQVLFNMATGSGKTLLMAAVLLEKYKQGERNFIFFVNNSNILTKTRDNFLGGAGSKKYLFSDKIIIDNHIVNIREVEDFSDAQSDSINIVFTTIQQLHMDLNTPKENRLSYEQFEDISVVLLADEAHHLNAGLNASEKKENTSWTSTIENIQKLAKRSSIFEFTATIDLSDKDISKKYERSLLYKYDLKQFRLDKYSKDVLFHLVDSDLETRMLQAIIISQYRKKIALKNNINLKPLIMFKSQKIAESRENYNLFLEALNELKAEKIEEQRLAASTSVGNSENNTKQKGILEKAFDFFKKEKISNEHLVEELKEEFRLERLLIIDGKNKTSDNLVTLNTLERPDNEIRAIFAVDMLNEGWDVLNLFDIVRLYDIRDGKTTKTGFKPGKTTNAEKQLIGRGARYYPFILEDNEEERFTRKFDNNEANELRVIEQLHYHSANNPRYISELKLVLRESGIYDDETLEERELNLKESFKKTRTYIDGVVWMNKRISYSKLVEARQQSLFEDSFIPNSFEVVMPTHNISDYEVFSDIEVETSPNLHRINFRFNKISKNIVRHAINRNRSYTFENLSKAIFGIASVDKFMEMLEKIDISVESSHDRFSKLTQNDKLYIAEKLLDSIDKNLIDKEERYFGTDQFEPKPIKELFEDKIIRKYTVNKNSRAEFGVSQKNQAATHYFEDLDNLDWYAYDDNFGTSEEKLLVRLIKDLMVELEEKWTDIYLLRNEKAVRIYSFDAGQAFEPDFLMFANDKVHGNASWQIFIEPKGSQFLDADNSFKNSKEGWKQDFLRQISERDEARKLADNDRYRIVGLPFFNDAVSKDEVKEELRRI